MEVIFPETDLILRSNHYNSHLITQFTVHIHCIYNASKLFQLQQHSNCVLSGVLRVSFLESLSFVLSHCYFKSTTYLYVYLPTHTSVSLPMPLLIIPVIGSLNPTLVWFNHKKILTICFMAPEMVNFLPYQQVTYFTLLCQENQWIHLKTLRSRLFLWKKCCHLSYILPHGNTHILDSTKRIYFLVNSGLLKGIY